MRKLLFLQPLIILSLLGKTVNAQSIEKEWTIMVFMNADNNLEPYGFTDFAEMSKIGSNDKINIVVQVDRFGGSEYMTTNPNWSNTLRFKVEKGMELLPKNALQDIGETNMGDPNVLKDFINWSTENYPAKKYMLIIWDHGDGWRFLDHKKINLSQELYEIYKKYIDKNILGEKNLDLFYKNKYLEKTAAGFQQNKYESQIFTDTTQPGILEVFQNQAYRGISHDQTNNDAFYNREIQDCLLDFLKGKKLDIIGFDACLMSMIETGYAFRNVAKFMIGSEELEPGEGWDYSIWLKKLADNPSIEAEELSKILIKSYEEAYKLRFDVTLSATNLEKIEDASNSLSSLSDALTKEMKIEYKNIRDARQLCIPYATKSGLHGIDLKTFLLHLNTKVTNPEIKQIIQTTINQLELVIASNYAAPGRAFSASLRSFGSFGLSIYFPETKFLFDTDKRAENGYDELNKVFPVEFVVKHRWDNLLKEFYKYVIK